MSTKQVDDGDSQVRYSSGWKQDNSLHGPTQSSSTATFTFTGTGVEVHGIVQNTGSHPTMKFTVDGGSTGTYTAPTVGNQNAFTFFQASGLSSGQHTLVISNQDVNDPPALWLDYFIITGASQDPPGGGNPPPQSSPSPQDPHSSPNFPTTPTPTPTPTSTSPNDPDPTTSSVDPPATSSHTSAPDSTGTQSLPTSTSSESSSDSDSATTSASGSSTASSGSSASSTSPASGSSTLVSSPGADASDSSSSYTSLPDHASTTSTKAFASSPSSSGVDPANPAVTDTAHAASRPNVGAIVGGVIGALLLLLLLLFALFLYRRRMKRKRGTTFIYPFTMDQPHTRDDMSEVGTVATTAEGILTTWAPEMFQVPSRSTVNLASGSQPPPLPRPTPTDVPNDVLMYSPSAYSTLHPDSSRPLQHQSVGSGVDVVDVSFVQESGSPGFEQLSPVPSRGSWPAL